MYCIDSLNYHNIYFTEDDYSYNKIILLRDFLTQSVIDNNAPTHNIVYYLVKLFLSF